MTLCCCCQRRPAGFRAGLAFWCAGREDSFSCYKLVERKAPQLVKRKRPGETKAKFQHGRRGRARR